MNLIDPADNKGLAARKRIAAEEKNRASGAEG